MIARRLRAGVNSVPPKEPPPAFSNVRGRLPKASTHRNLEPDPIYPLSTLLVRIPLWQRACQFPKDEPLANHGLDFLSRKLSSWAIPLSEVGQKPVHLQYVRCPLGTNDNRPPSVLVRNRALIVCPTREGPLPIRPSLRPCCKNVARCAADRRAGQ